MVPLFTAAIFVAAFLLFLIQPLAARLVLPRLGGTPAVWTGTMMFFQFLLLAGYAYAHILGRLPARAQGIIHAVVLGSCLVFIPLALPGWWDAGSLPPLASLLVGLAASVGVPFFIISSASPLIQSWFARTGHPRAHDPYFLYAASNAGSLLGLLAYPVVVEPTLGLRGQGWAWSIGYFACAVLLAACWWFAWKRSRRAAAATVPQAKAASSTTRKGAQTSTMPAAAKPGSASLGVVDDLDRNALWRRRFAWVGLAAAPSSLSLGVTQFLTTDVAAVPLLWVMPLAVYLLTYIVAFSRAGAAAERIGRLLLPILATAVTAAILLKATSPLLVVGGLHLSLLAAAGLVCHGRLAALRPRAARLTEFYLLASLGGALGGAFNAIAAPLVFDVVLEYPLAIAACCALMVLRPSPATAPSPAITKRASLLRAMLPVLGAVVATGVVVIGMEALVAIYSLDEERVVAGVLDAKMLGRLLTVGIPCILAFLASRRALVFAAVIGTLTGQATTVPIGRSRFEHEILLTERSFFGVCMVLERQPIPGPEGGLPQPGLRSLQHGTTLHGQQFINDPRELEPLSYYTRRGPVGDTFARLPESRRRVAVIGLGAGSIASYGRPGDRFDFFEIDPLVARLAQDQSLFTFLSGCRAEAHVIIGDGRLKIAEQPAGVYDLIILDAFSSDSIPVHLLTVEAMAIYKQRLKPGGALLVHISNQHFLLRDPVARVGRELGLRIIHEGDAPTNQEIWETGAMFSNWVVLSEDARWLGTFNGAGWEWVEWPQGQAWTDDHANVLEALRWD